MIDKKASYTLEEIKSSYQLLETGKAHIANGHESEAERIFRRLIDDFPEYYAAHRSLAGLYIKRKNYQLAFQHLALALAGDNLDYYSMLNLEAIAFELGQIDAGEQLSLMIETIGSQLGLKKHSDVHYFNKGNILLKKNEYKKASIEYKKCLRSKRNSEQPAIKLIRCYIHMGQHKEALALCESYLSKKPDRAFQFVQSIASLPTRFIKKNTKRYLRIANDFAPLDDEQQIMKMFTVAKYEHVSKNYKQAWSLVREANQRIRKDVEGAHLYTVEREKELMQWAKDLRVKKKTPQDNQSEAIPLYILGPSRSGKTSLETALEWLPGYRKGHECKILSQSTSHAFNTGDQLPSGALAMLPDDLMPEFANFYRSAFRQSAKDASVYTTTTPGLIGNVPAILYAKPDAKFIFLHRAPDDVAFRMFFTNYRTGNLYSYDLAWCRAYISWYYELVDIWSKKFQQSILIINYEEMINHPNLEVKRVLEFIGRDDKVPEDMEIPGDHGFSYPYLDMR